MRPTLRQLQYIVAVAEKGRFHEAAKSLYVSQPSLSAQIADVEAQLGVQLIERGRQGALMTALGDEFVKRARLILRDVEDLKTAMHVGSGPLTGRIRLGVLPSVGPYLLPSAIKPLHRDYPSLRLSVEENNTIGLQDHLADGTLDCVISTAEDHSASESITLFEENLWICAAPDDPISGKGPVNPSELKGRPLLSVGVGHRLAETVQQIADLSGSFISTEFQGTSLDAIRQMAAMGAGVAILPAVYALSEARRDDALVLRPIAHPLARRKISLIWRTGSPLTDSLTLIADALSKAAADILQNDTA